MYRSPVGCTFVLLFVVITVVIFSSAVMAFVNNNPQEGVGLLFASVIAGMCTVGLARGG